MVVYFQDSIDTVSSMWYNVSYSLIQTKETTMIKEETRIENLLRRVSNCDTEAGKKLRYHLIRSRCSEEYAKELNFGVGSNWSKLVGRFPPSLSALFVFNLSPEGHDYWRNICNLMK